jgi:hypothetical protein
VFSEQSLFSGGDAAPQLCKFSGPSPSFGIVT